MSQVPIWEVGHYDGLVLCVLRKQIVQVANATHLRVTVTREVSPLGHFAGSGSGSGGFGAGGGSAYFSAGGGGGYR